MPGHPKSWTGSAHLVGAGVLSAVGVDTVPPKTWAGAASLTGAGVLSAQSVVSKFGAASLTGAGVLSASGSRFSVHTGTAQLAGTGTLSAAGSVSAGGSSWTGTATLAGAGALSGTGVRTVSGTATLTGSGSLTAAGITTRFGAATLTGTGSLAAAGVVTGDAKAVPVFRPGLSCSLARLEALEQWLAANCSGWQPATATGLPGIRNVEEILTRYPINGTVYTMRLLPGTSDYHYHGTDRLWAIESYLIEATGG